jgi:hypothetical protein
MPAVSPPDRDVFNREGEEIGSLIGANMKTQSTKRRTGLMEHGATRRQMRALHIIGRRGRAGASAFEIGNAIVGRNVWPKRSVYSVYEEQLGLEIGTGLVRTGLVTATRENRFILARYRGRSVPTGVEADDLGFRRIAR